MDAPDLSGYLCNPREDTNRLVPVRAKQVTKETRFLLYLDFEKRPKIKVSVPTAEPITLHFSPWANRIKGKK